MAEVTLKTLNEIGRNIRAETVGTDSLGQCYPASKSLCTRLVQETPAEDSEVEVEEVLVGPSATIRHYVVAYPAKYITDTDAYGRVIIDITLDQYSTENEENGDVQVSFGAKDDIPDVVIYEAKEQAPYSG